MIKSNVIVHDVLEMFLINKTSGEAMFFGCLTESNINKAEEMEEIRCGIGAKLSEIVALQQDISFSVTTAKHSDHIIELQAGNLFASGNINVWQAEQGLIATAGLTVDITGTPVDDAVQVQDKFGKKYVGAYLTGTVTITGGVEGEEYTVTYQEALTAVDILDFDITKSASDVAVMLHGIAYYDNIVVSDIYYDLPRCRPDGNLDLAYAMKSNVSQQVNFKVKAIGNSLGKYIVADR